MSSKKLNVVLYTICCILALYGLIILIRKMMLASDGVRQSKKELGMKFYIEPFRQKSAKQEYDECMGKRCKGSRCRDLYMKCKSQYKLYCEDNPDDLDCKSFKEREEGEEKERKKFEEMMKRMK